MATATYRLVKCIRPQEGGIRPPSVCHLYPLGKTIEEDEVEERFGACRNSLGLLRLRNTREWFYQEGNLDGLVDVYREWRDQPEYLHLAKFVGDEKVAEVAVLCSKRGNSIYRHRLKRRLAPLLDLKGLPEGNRSWNKTRLLFVTLTYDTKRCSPREAWLSISDEFNRWIALLRKNYGELSYLKAVEATRRGYPHIHLVILFKEAEFSYFSLNGKFRIPRKERDRMRSGWHSFVDVEAVVSPRQAIAYTIKYVLKAHGEKVKGKTPWEISEEGVEKTLALLWVYKRRGWSVSEDILEALADLIARPCRTQTVQVDLEGNSLEKWVCLGVKPAWELGIREDPPPWVVVLWEK